jgi:transketolase
MRDQFIRTLTDVARHDPAVMLITADLGFGVLTDFASEHPEQYINVGVAEQNMVGVATGLALSGRLVFTYSIANFPTLRCLEQIRNDICHHNLPVATVAVGGGLSYGPLGFSHHATEDIAALRALPEISIVVPGTTEEVDILTRDFLYRRSPTYLRLDRSSPGVLDNIELSPVEYGKLRVLRRGRDVVLISLGGVLADVLAAADSLERDNISCTIINCHTLKPFDCHTLLQETEGRTLVVTVEEHSVIGGLGSAVAEVLAEHPHHAPLKRLGLPEAARPAIVGSQRYLRDYFGLGTDGIVEAVRHGLDTLCRDAGVS